MSCLQKIRVLKGNFLVNFLKFRESDHERKKNFFYFTTDHNLDNMNPTVPSSFCI